MLRTRKSEESRHHVAEPTSSGLVFEAEEAVEKKRPVLLHLVTKAVIFVALTGGITYGAYELVSGRFAQRRLAEELAAAKAEGIVTSAKEVNAIYQEVRQQTNAGMLAHKMLGMIPKNSDIRGVSWDACFSTDAKSVQLGKELIDKNPAFVSLAAETASRPYYSVKRDYELGGAVLAPELASLHFGAEVLTLRAGLALRDDHPEAALKDMKNVGQLIDHMQGDLLGTMYGSTYPCRERTLQLLATWAWNQPKNQSWLDEYKKGLDKFPIQTEREISRYQLAFALATFDALEKHGRVKMGFKSEVPVSMEALAKLNPVIQGKIRLVKGFRKAWGVMDTVSLGAEKQRADAEFLYGWGLLSDPVAYRILSTLNGRGNLDHRDKIIKQKNRRALFQAAYEVLSKPREKARLMTASSVLSPSTGKPLRIKWTKEGFEIIDSQAIVPSPDQVLQVPPTRRGWKDISY